MRTHAPSQQRFAKQGFASDSSSLTRRLRAVLLSAVLGLLSTTSAFAAPVYVVSGAPDDGRGIVYYGTNDGEERTIWWGGQRLVHVSDSPSFVNYDEIGVFCFEPYTDLPFEFEPLTYNIGSLTDFGLNGIQQNRLQILVDNAYSVLLDDNHPYDFSVRATAFQVAIWEIINDGATNSALNLTTKLTRVDVLPSDNAEIHQMFSLANNWIGHLNAGDWFATGEYQYKVLMSDEWQDLGYVVKVPEPSTAVLAGLALVGLVAMRRRRQA